MQHHETFSTHAPDPLPYSVNIFFVLLGWAVAVLGSYTALSFAEGLTSARLSLKVEHAGAGAAARILGATIFSLSCNSIWVMHFVSTSAVTYPGGPVRYELGETTASLLAIAVGCTLGILIFLAHPGGLLSSNGAAQASDPFTSLLASRPSESESAGAHLSHWLQQVRAALGARLFVGGAFVGAGVYTMHHLGMHAARLRARAIWNPIMVGLTPLVGTVAGAAVLLILFTAHGLKRRVPASIILGTACCLAHYYGYGSVTYVRLPPGQFDMSAWAGETLIDAKVASVVVLLVSSVIRFALVGLIAVGGD